MEPPEGEHWPCLTARRLIDGKYPEMASWLSTAKYNSRGLHEVSSEIEIDLAQRYQASADALRSTYPNTAAMLDDMAEDHRRREVR